MVKAHTQLMCAFELVGLNKGAGLLEVDLPVDPIE